MGRRIVVTELEGECQAVMLGMSSHIVIRGLSDTHAIRSAMIPNMAAMVA